jgi:hypothetical protein
MILKVKISIVNIISITSNKLLLFYLKVLANNFGHPAIIWPSKDNNKNFNTVILCYWDPMHYKILKLLKYIE